jgi:N-acetylmuramic acid 6-phosphate (MurNAc-6-P) etherase
LSIWRQQRRLCQVLGRDELVAVAASTHGPYVVAFLDELEKGAAKSPRQVSMLADVDTD